MSKASKRLFRVGANLQVILDTVGSAGQCDASDEQYKQYDIGKCRCEVHDLHEQYTWVYNSDVHSQQITATDTNTDTAHETK